MSFWEWIFWIYVIGIIVSWPISSKWFYQNDLDDEPVLAITMGFCVCWFWPLFIPGYWIYEWVVKEG